MTEQRRDTSGDYGYDMAHEGSAQHRIGGAAPADDPRHQRHATPGPGQPADHDGDYGYDEAHDF